MKQTLSILIITLIFFSCKREKQDFVAPKVLDSIPLTSSKMNSKKMLEGGYKLLGVSKDTIFEVKDLENKNNEYFLTLLQYMSKYDEEMEDTITFNSTTEYIPISPPPPTIIELKTQKNNSIEIFVDSNQLLNIPNYTDNREISEIIKKGISETYIDYYENGKKSLFKYHKPSKEQKQAYPIFIFNKSDTIFNIALKEGWIKMIQQAVDKNGRWKPIEYYDPIVVCGNSFDSEPLLPNYYGISKIYKYDGNFKTKIRVKLISERNIYYSNEFLGSININQFKIPNSIYNKEKKEIEFYFLDNK